jgi:Type I restriction enzyme R protein N terminus (HSDR_N)
MQKLNFPYSDVSLRLQGEQKRIFDKVRKKWMVLTPEEWVRQHLIIYLHQGKGCPLELMAVEKSLEYNGMVRRSDVVVYGRNSMPMLLVECKAPEIKITQKTFDQAAQYNMSLLVPYLLVTNGLEHFCCKIDHHVKSYHFLKEIPTFDEMSSSPA